MLLRDLSERPLPDVVLLQSPSNLLTIYMVDKLKARIGTTRDTIIEVHTQKDLAKVRDLQGIVPPFGDKWFVQIDLMKLNNKELHRTISMSTTVTFLCTCENYGVFKKFKDSFRKTTTVIYDFYFKYLRTSDFLFLYDTICPDKLDKNLLKFVREGYSGDIDVCMQIFKALHDGTELKTKRQITEQFGIGGLTTESYLLNILNFTPSTSERGAKTKMKNRVKAGLELVDALGYSTTHNYLLANLKSFIQIKELLISGTIYKRIENLPTGYNESKLSRYNRFIWRLKDIPMSRLLSVYTMLEPSWHSDADFLRFMYMFEVNEYKGANLK